MDAGSWPWRLASWRAPPVSFFSFPHWPCVALPLPTQLAGADKTQINLPKDFCFKTGVFGPETSH